MLRKIACLFLALAVLSMPVIADASGGSGGGGGGGGGGGSTGIQVRLVGYATAIDYTNGRIVVGQLYYGNGAITVSSDTKISINNVAGTLNDIQLNDFCEVRYDSVTRVASKVTVTR